MTTTRQRFIHLMNMWNDFFRQTCWRCSGSGSLPTDVSPVHPSGYCPCPNCIGTGDGETAEDWRRRWPSSQPSTKHPEP